MTNADKAVTRKTYSMVRERGRVRQVVVAIHPTWLSLRLAGTRKTFVLDVEGAYQYAAKLEAQRVRLEKVQARVAASKAKGGR